MEAIKNSSLISTAPPPEQLAPAPRVAGQFGITRRTLGRWILDQTLAFPRPVEINGRLYFKQHEIDEWKLGRSRRSLDEKVAA